MGDRMKITMQDIANEAGVDQSTVSLALRNSPKISAETKERIQNLAQERGYRPNPLISALMQTRKGRDDQSGLLTIAYLSFEEMSSTIQTGHVYSDFEQGARQEADRFGFKLETFKVSDSLSVARIDRILNARGIRGVVIAPLPEGLVDLHLSWDQLASIAIGPTLRHPVLHRVMSDYYDNMHQLLTYARELGYRRIGLCLDTPTDCRLEGQWEGCFLHYVQHHRELEPVPIFIPGQASKTSFLSWIETNQPDLVIGVRTVRLIQWINEAGISVPGDLSVATVAVARPGGEVSGVVEAGASAGALAVNKLIGFIHANETGVPKVPVKHLIPAVIHAGSTMGEAISEKERLA